MGPLQDQHALRTMKTFSNIVRIALSIWLTMFLSLASGQSPSNTKAPGPVPVEFAPVSARLFRFTALKELGTGGWTSAAEISVLPTENEAGR